MKFNKGDLVVIKEHNGVKPLDKTFDTGTSLRVAVYDHDMKYATHLTANQHGIVIEDNDTMLVSVMFKSGRYLIQRKFIKKQ